MAEADWLGRITGVRAWTRGDERAPHKPLLLLLLLGRVQRSGSSAASYAGIEQQLGSLLGEFGPPRKTSGAYPFHHLQTDGFWTVTTADGQPTKASSGALRAADAVGRLDPELEAELLRRPDLLVLGAHALLDDNWEPSLHADILSAVGLDLEQAEMGIARGRMHEEVVERRRRDRHFREHVLVAYEYRCAFCEFDGRLGAQSVGLDAAHVRWWAFEGPDEVSNGLCLCTIHHKLFDLGALGLTAERTVQVSKQFVGRGGTARQLVTDLQGRTVGEPQAGEPFVHSDHVQWHGREVFRSPARVA